MSRFTFRARKPLMKATMVLGMFPSFMGMTAVYLLMTQFGLINRLTGLILIYAAGAPMGYLTQKGFFDTIPKAIDEAAKIDGATPSQILKNVTIPMVMPSITICTFLTLTNGFKMFDQNLSLTGGDPGKQSQLLALNIYDTFYARSGPQWKGIGQAKAVVFFILVIVIALIQLRATSSKEVQQ